MAGTDINIGSLLFDVGVDPAQVRKLTGEMRQMGQTAKEAFERPRKAADPLKQSVEKIRNEIYGLRSAYIAGTLSEKQFREEMTRLKGEALGTAKGLDRTGKEFRQLNIAAATAERGLATLRGEASRLGLASQVNIALNQRMSGVLRTMGPAGSAAAMGLTALGNSANGLIPVFGTKLPAALQTTLGLLTTLQVLAPAAVAVGLVALTKFADKAAQTADAIDKNSQSAGLSVEAYQELAFAFDQSGIKADQFRQALSSLNRRLGEAAQGNKAYADAYKRLGIDIRDANGSLRESEEIIVEALDALGKLPSSAQQASLAAKIFGDDVGKKLVPVIRQGAEGIEELRQQARDLGLVLSGDAVLSLVGYKDEMAALRQQFSTAGIEITASFLPILRDGLIPLLQEHVVPWVQSLAENLGSVADNFMDAGVTGAMFRDQMADLISPFVQLVSLIGAASAGINKLNLDIQLFGSDLGKKLGLGDADFRRGVDQVLGMVGIDDTSFLDSPLFGFPSQGEAGGNRQEQEVLRRQFQQDMNDWMNLFVNAGDATQSSVDDLAKRWAEQREKVRTSQKALVEAISGGSDTETAAEDAERAYQEAQKALRTASLVRPEALARSMTAEAARGSDRQFMSLPGSVHSVGPAVARLEVERSIREAGERQARAIADAYVGGFRAAEGDINEEALKTLAANAIRERLRAVDAAIAQSIEDAVLRRAAPQVESQSIGFGVSEARGVRNTDHLRGLGQRAVEEASRQARIDSQNGSQRVLLSQGLRAAERTLQAEAEALAEVIRQGRVAIAADTVESQSFSFGRSEAMSVGRSGALSDRGKDGIFSNNHRAFNQGVTPFRGRNRRSDGGLAEAGEINAAREALERTQAQIDEMAGKGPSQFDVLRDAVEKFGQASGKSENEIAALVAQVDELEKQDNLISTLQKVSGTLKTLGGAASGTPLGDALTGMGELVDIGMKFASGDILGGITAVAAEMVAGFTAASKASQQLRDDLEAVQDRFSLIDTGNLSKTKSEKVGTIFGLIPIYGEVFDEVASDFGLSIAEALESGVMSGLKSGLEAYRLSGDIEDLEAGIEEGLKTAISNALFESLINEAIIKGALGPMLTEMAEAFAAGDTARAKAIAQEINSLVPGLAADMAAVADEFDFLRPDQDTPVSGDSNSSNPTGISIPIAPNPVMAAPAWVPEFGGYVADFGEGVGEFRRGVRELRGQRDVASDLRQALT